MQTTVYYNLGGRQMALFPQANGLSLLWNDKQYQSVGLRASVHRCSAGIWAMRPGCQQKAIRQIWQYGRSVDLFCLCFFFFSYSSENERKENLNVSSNTLQRTVKASEAVFNRCMYYRDISFEVAQKCSQQSRGILCVDVKAYDIYPLSLHDFSVGKTVLPRGMLDPKVQLSQTDRLHWSVQKVKYVITKQKEKRLSDLWPCLKRKFLLGNWWEDYMHKEASWSHNHFFLWDFY